MRILIFMVFATIFGANAQLTIKQENSVFTDLTGERGFPEYNYEFSNLIPANKNVVLDLSFNAPVSFLGIGWNSTEETNPSSFRIKYRSSNDGINWTDYQELDGETAPEETPTGLYWSEAMFSYDAESYIYFEVEFFVPVQTEGFKLIAFDGNTSGSDEITNKKEVKTVKPKSGNCPEFPEMITRSEWCGGSANCSDVNTSYNYTNISPTHVVMHHGAAPATYTNGQAVVQSYYNYHANTLGWLDIGYHYLIDKHGNFYQGRYNPNLPTTDVRGAHAGTDPNNNSIGICFPGDLDSELATPVQLEKLYELLAWWFDYNDIDVLDSSGMLTQDYGWQIQPHFTGHRDIGNTFCPGDDLHGQLPAIRTETQAIIDACLDDIPPTTTAETNYEWRGYDFWVDFIDEDNPGGSGVDRKFYQPIEFDGTEWRCNAEQGYFNDNFNQNIHTDWTDYTGNWSIANENLVQIDQNEGNSNIYAYLNQNDNAAYQYHWQMRIEGNVSTNRRAGLHFFASDPEAPHRENSYLVWWRADDNAFHLYRIENDVLNLVQNIPLNIDLDTWYDIKVTYDPQNGEIEVYTDDELTVSWTDSSPFISGDYISLRNGDSEVLYNNFKVRKSRDSEELVTVGDDQQKYARYESPNPNQDALRVNSMVIDSAKNWSTAYEKNIYVDWTAPISTINLNSSFQSDDFTVNFNDNDNSEGSGVGKTFYSVIDNNDGNWSANLNNGFLIDSLNSLSLNNNWEIVDGNWQMSNSYLEQTDENENNTNIYIPLNQNLSDRYLYDFDFKIDGSGSNKRGGFHYFADDPEESNRGNSYFLWFRQDLETIEIFKVENNVFTPMRIHPFSFDADEWINVKLIYDRITGEHLAYVNDNLMAEWIDEDPHFNGDYVSFRSGNSIMGVKNFAVHRTRGNSVQISVGGSSADIRYNNQSPNTPDGQIRTIIHDQAHNLSEVTKRNIIITESTANTLTDELEKVVIYPNPFSNNITVEGIEGIDIQNVEVLDATGKLVISASKEHHGNQIHIVLPNNLAKGSYHLRIKSPQGFKVYKLQKQ